MAQKRRKFSPQYKAEVAAWHEKNPEPEKALTPTEKAKVAEMEDELHKLRLENEFLKKAAFFFARTQP